MVVEEVSAHEVGVIVWCPLIRVLAAMKQVELRVAATHSRAPDGRVRVFPQVHVLPATLAAMAHTHWRPNRWTYDCNVNNRRNVYVSTGD